MAYEETLHHSLVTFELDGNGTPKTGFVERQYTATLNGEPMPNRRTREVLGPAELQALMPDQAALVAQVQALTAERDALQAQVDAHASEKAALQAQIDALKSPEDVNGVPQEVSMYQARAALIGAGLYDQVNAAVTASADDIVKVAWEYATVVKRSSPFIAAMSGALGLDDATIDQLFVTASQIN